jgi:hypothetical protein
MNMNILQRCIIGGCLELVNWVGFEECRLMGCGTVWVYYKPTFRRNMSPPSSGYKKYSSLSPP